LHRLGELDVVPQTLEAEQVLQSRPGRAALVRDAGDHAAHAVTLVPTLNSARPKLWVIADSTLAASYYNENGTF